MKTRTLALNALLIAIIVLMSVIPFLGFIQIGPIAITLSHIPVIIGAIILGPVSGAVLGVTFGLGSWYAALTRGATPVDLLFTNPLVAILPRLLFGLAAAYLWKLVRLKNQQPSASKIAFTAFSSTLVHTVAVLSTIYLTIQLTQDQTLLTLIASGFMPFVLGAVGVNVLMEALTAIFVSSAILSALGFVKKSRKPDFIPRPLTQANQIFMILVILAVWLTKQPLYLLFPLAFGLLGILFNDNPIIVIGRRFLKKPLDSYHREDPDAQKFSQMIALILLTIALAAFLINLDYVGYIASGLVVIAAALAIAGFCIGCYLFFKMSLKRQHNAKK